MPPLHRAWPGNNRFLCHCCVTGPGRDAPGLLFVYVCMISVLVAFTVFMLPNNWNVSPVLPILYYATCFTLNLFVMLTACSDPGIIPRRPFLLRHK